MSQGELFPELGRWSPAAFINVLQQADFTHAATAGLPGFIRAPHLETLRAIASASLAELSDPRATALKMFALGEAVPLQDALELLGWQVKELADLGLLELLPEKVRSRFKVTPAADHQYYISDFPDYHADPRGDIVLGVSPAARQLFALTPPVQSGARVLEAGCGIAWLARKLAGEGAVVSATDINPRAIELARLNGVVSGIDSVSYHEGDFFDGAKGDGPFDLIMCNPPYVVSPASGLIYRDSTKDDSICRSIIERAPSYLAPGGMAVVMINWGHASDDDWRDAPLSWCADVEHQYWINQLECVSAQQYAWRWIGADPRHEGRDRSVAEMRRWLDYYTRLGYRRISSGFIVVRKPASDQEPGWKRADSKACKQQSRAAGEDIQRVMLNESWLRRHEPDPADLLGRTYTIADGIRTQVESRLKEGWIRTGIKLFSPGTLSYEGDIDESLLRLLELIEQGHLPQQMIVEIREKHGQAIPDHLEPSLANIVEQLIRYGLIIPKL